MYTILIYKIIAKMNSSLNDFITGKNLLIFAAMVLLFTQCRKDPANLTDPAPGTPALSFTFDGTKYEYVSNGIKDSNGKALDAFGNRVVNNLTVSNYKTHIEVSGTSNNVPIQFSATYNSVIPLAGDNVLYTLKVGNDVYTLSAAVTDVNGNNYVTFFNGKTANFYQGKFSGEFIFFAEAGIIQRISITDGTFLVTQAKDQ